MTEGYTPQPETPTPAAEENRRQGRRRLIKAALLATPLIITLRGKPAHAQLSSLGSIDTPDGPIMYGPGAYVQSGDKIIVNGEEKEITPDNEFKDLIGKELKKSGNDFEILKDRDRRQQDGSGQIIKRD